MNDEILNDLAIEKTCKERFHLSIDIAEVIVRGAPTGQTSRGTIFRTAQGHMFLFIVSQGVQVLDDVQKIVRRMECEADFFVPPFGEAEYFERIGREKFKALFPGKPILGDEDLRYYKNLAPYSPALVRLSKIKGEIRAFNGRAKIWRKVKDFSYSKIRTS